MSHRRQQGFTLIELIIAVAIIGALAGLAIPAYVGYLDKARLARCIAEIRYIEHAIDAFEAANESLPTSLAEAGAGELVDPWGNPYEFLNIAALVLPGGGAGGASGGGGAAKKGAWRWWLPDEAYAAQPAGNGPAAKPRKDRFLHPINSDYDLYSMGKDGKTVESLTAKMSHDDVIRGNDGQFVGLAAEF